MRSADPAAAARAFVAAGRYPADITAEARAPFVKICGVTDEAGVLAAVRAGADAIGLNFAPGTPRALSIEEGVALARLARAAATADAPAPRIVIVTADLPADELRRVVEAVDPDAIQLSGDEPASAIAALGRPAWKALKVRPDDDPDAVDRPGPRLPRRRRRADPARHGRRAAPGRDGRSRGCRHRGGGGAPGPGHARRRPPCRQRRRRAAGDPRERRRRRLGDGRRRGSTGERPRKDPLRVALFVKRARDARRHRPNVAFGPAPVHPGLLEVDGAGRWGMERDFGGRYVPETLVAALEQLEAAYDAVRHDPRFWAELDDLLRRYAGRPTALYRADRLPPPRRLRLARAAIGRARVAIPAFRLYLKREDLAHTGAHKINNALGQALLTRRLGKTRVIAETGAGQHGVATATACALLALPVRRVHGRGGHPASGPERAPDAGPGRGGPERHVRHRHAQGRRQRGDARLGHERRDDALRARIGDGAAPVPDDRARPPAADRRRGGGAAAGRRRAAAGHGARLRRRGIERHRPAVAVHRRAIGAAGGGRGGGRRDLDRATRGGDRRRDGRDPPRIPIADAPGPRRAGRRGALGVRGARLPGRRAAARGARGGRAARGRDGDGPRGCGGDARRSPATEGILPALETAHAIAALPKLLPAWRARDRPGRPTRRSCCSGSPAAATRTSRRSSGSPTSSPGTSTDDDRRAARLLPRRCPARTRRRPGATPSTRATSRSGSRTRST